MGQRNREQRVAAAFVALADTLVDDYDVIDLLDQLVGQCVALLDVSAAGLLVSDSHGELRSVAASSDDARTMELLQLHTGEGPCLEAWLTVTQVRVPDLKESADRWPKFVAAAAAENLLFASVHSIPLRLRGQSIGALNLFHNAPGELPEADLALAQALADVVTIGILQQRAIRHSEDVAEQLQAALNSRVVVEQAKGLVSQRLGIDMGLAFALLRGRARSTKVRLSEVARRVVDGELDPVVLSESADFLHDPSG